MMTEQRRKQDGKMKIEGWGWGISGYRRMTYSPVEQRAKCHPLVHYLLMRAVVFFPFPDLSIHIVSISFTSFIHVDKVHKSDMSASIPSWALMVV